MQPPMLLVLLYKLLAILMNVMITIPKLVVNFVDSTVKRSIVQQSMAEIEKRLVDENVSNEV